MATYDIAPATTGSEIGLAQMRFGLSASADYNASNIHSATSTSMETLVLNSTTYQSNLTSKTWNTSTPYSFSEMAGQTWNDAPSATISYGFYILNALTLSVTVRLGSATGTVLYTGGAGTGTLNASVGDTIYLEASANHPSDPYSLTGQYRVPNSGLYNSLFGSSSGPSGGNTSGNGTFTITSPNTTAGITVTA